MALIATMLVNLKANAEQFNRAMGQASLRTSAFERQAKAVGAAAGRAFLYIGTAAAGMAAVTLRAYAQQEEAERGLRAALNATGQAAGLHMERLLEAAAAIQRVTTVGDEAALGLMKYATNLGISAQQLPGVTRAAIGLAEALGIDVESAVRYVALALQGQFTTLQRYIPALRTAADMNEKLAIVLRIAAGGFVQGEEKAKGFWGRIQQLRNELDEVAERIGAALAPAIQSLVGWLRTLAAWIGGLNEAHVRWAALATGAVLAITGLIYVMSKLVAAVHLAKIAYAAYGVVKAWVLGMTGAGIILVAAAAVAAAAAGLAIYELAKSWEDAAEKAKKANEEQDKILSTLKGVTGAATDAAKALSPWVEEWKNVQETIEPFKKRLRELWDEIEILTRGITAEQLAMERLIKTMEYRGTEYQIADARELAEQTAEATAEVERLRTAFEATEDAQQKIDELRRAMIVLRGVEPAWVGEQLTKALLAAQTPADEITRLLQNMGAALEALSSVQLTEILEGLSKGADPANLTELVRRMAEFNRLTQEQADRAEAAREAEQKAEGVRRFAEGVKESLKTPVERFKEFREQLREAVEAGLLGEAEMTAALQKKMGDLMGRRRDEGKFMEISRGIDIKGLMGREAKPELQKLDEQIDILDDIRNSVREGGGLV